VNRVVGRTGHDQECDSPEEHDRSRVRPSTNLHLREHVRPCRAGRPTPRPSTGVVPDRREGATLRLIGTRPCGASNEAIWETSAVSIVRLREQCAALVIVGVSGCVLAACSGQAASTTSTARPGTGFIGVTTRPPPTAAQASQLVKAGCRSLPVLPAAIASAAATYSHDPSGALMALYHGPWYRAVSMGGTGTDAAFAHVAADAKTFDLAALASLKSGRPTGVATSIAQLARDCRAINQSIG
jgi:hypothetical protein